MSMVFVLVLVIVTKIPVSLALTLREHSRNYHLRLHTGSHACTFGFMFLQGDGMGVVSLTEYLTLPKDASVDFARNILEAFLDFAFDG